MSLRNVYEISCNTYTFHNFVALTLIYIYIGRLIFKVTQLAQISNILLRAASC